MQHGGNELVVVELFVWIIAVFNYFGPLRDVKPKRRGFRCTRGVVRNRNRVCSRPMCIVHIAVIFHKV